MVRVSANGSAVRVLIPSRIIPKTQKWYLMPLYFTLSIIRESGATQEKE